LTVTVDAPLLASWDEVASGREVRGDALVARACSSGDACAAARVAVARDGRVAYVGGTAPATLDGVAFERADGAVGHAAVKALARPAVPPTGLEIVWEDDLFAVARWRLEAGRSFTAGPESERHLAALAGSGLAFLETGDALRLDAPAVLVAPAGWPVRIWARDAMEGVVVQPQGAAAEQRTLKGELERLRAREEAPLPGTPR